MWIMLIKKLPTDPSPPKLSIFWSTSWTDNKYSVAQRKKVAAAARGYTDHGILPTEDQEYFLDAQERREPNWIMARKVLYRGYSIRVFPHEFREQPTARMREFILSPVPSHELVVSSTAGESVMRDIKSGTRRPIYDAALMDGCNHAQALMTAWGKDVTISNAEFLPVGWYRCVPEYAHVFCKDWEMTE